LGYGWPFMVGRRSLSVLAERVHDAKEYVRTVKIIPHEQHGKSRLAEKLRALRAQLLLVDNAICNALPWRHDTTSRRHAGSRLELVDDTHTNRNLAARGRR
jgi:hypothetical protein